MLTFQNLQDEVLGWLDEGDNTDAPDASIARVQTALNQANAKRVSARRWRFMLQEPALTFTLVPGTRTYALDATVAIPVYFWNDTQNVPLTEFDPESVPSRNYQSGGLIDDYFASGPQDMGYTLGHQSINLTYTPASADVISYGFYKLPTEMDDDADLPDIPYPHSRILVYDALLTMAVYNEDISGAKLAEWREERKEMQEALDSAFGQENSQWTQGRYITYIPRD